MTTKLTTFEEEKLREYEKNFTYANFTWNGDNATGKHFAQQQKSKFKKCLLSSIREARQDEREMIRKDYVTWVLAGSYASYARKYKGKTPFQEWRQSAEAKDMDDWT